MEDKSAQQPPTPDQNFAKRVERARESRNWSQTELARRMKEIGFEGFHQTTISRIEKGTRPVRIGEAVALAELFDKPLESMLSEPSDLAAHYVIDSFVRRAVNWRNDSVQVLTKYLWSVEALRDMRRQLTNADFQGEDGQKLESILSEHEEVFGWGIEHVVQPSEQLFSQLKDVNYMSVVSRKLDELWPGTRAASDARRANRLLEQRIKREADGEFSE